MVRMGIYMAFEQAARGLELLEKTPDYNSNE